MLHVCPTEVVRARAERVWVLVATPTELAQWTETRLIEAPARELRPELTEADGLVVGDALRRLDRAQRLERHAALVDRLISSGLCSRTIQPLR